MQSPRRFAAALALLGANFLFASNAHAQLYGPGVASVSSNAFIEAGNLSSDGSGNIAAWETTGQYSPTGQAVSTTGSQSFTGLDSQGHTQTMTLSGTARAQAGYGVLHTYASGQFSNPYYNAANPVYYAGGSGPNLAGSPQYLDVVGQTLFQDTLTLNPTIDPIVGLRYIFHVEGNITEQHGYTYLAFSSGADSTTFFADITMPTTDWTTPEWNVTPGNSIGISGNFGAVYGANTNYYTTPEGVDVSGTTDYSNTLLLSSIQLLDAQGNQVNGATYLTASGATYNIAGATYGPAAVPEPGSMALLGSLALPIAAFLLRRRGR